MHHGSRRFPARPVTAGVSAESAGVCKAPSVICGLRFHGLDFKRCLARLPLASSHTQAPAERGVRSSLSRRPLLPQGTFSRGVRGGLLGQITAGLSLLGEWFPQVSEKGSDGLHRVSRAWRGWGVWGGRFSRSHRPGRERGRGTAI